MTKERDWLRDCESQKLARDSERLEERMNSVEEGIPFDCSVCGIQFWVPSHEYDGRWDHPPNEPICGKCADDDGYEGC